MSSKNFEEIIRGFFWGLGFAVSVIGVATVYTLKMAASVDKGFKDNIRLNAITSVSELAPNFEVALSEIFKENGEVKITAELKNISNENLYAVGVVASTFDSNGKFIGKCVGSGTDITLQPNEVSYVEINCEFFRIQGERVHSVKLKPKLF